MFDYDMVDAETEALDYEMGVFGDPRRCVRHPDVQTSSDDGMFDCDCYKCEGESEEAYQRHMAYIELHATLPVACGDNGADTGYGPACNAPRHDLACFVDSAQFDADNEIPF